MDTVTVVLLIVLAAMGAVFAVAARRETARDRARRERLRAEVAPTTARGASGSAS
ncbi:MAG TPA: hypothetical protein VI916_08625 [Acidimicrobiia bacterium]|nr:hypothetical protein [Acidimicrobiia bacterium]